MQAAAWAVAVIAFVAVMFAFVFAEDKATRFFRAIGEGVGGGVAATHTFIKTEMGIPPFVVYGGLATIAYATYVWQYQCEAYRKVRGYIKVYNDWKLINSKVSDTNSTFSKIVIAIGTTTVAAAAPSLILAGAATQISAATLQAFLAANTTMMSAATAAVTAASFVFGDKELLSSLNDLKESFVKPFQTWLTSDNVTDIVMIEALLKKHDVNKEELIDYVENTSTKGFIWGSYGATSAQMKNALNGNIEFNPGCSQIGRYVDTTVDLSETCKKNVNDPNCVRAFATVISILFPQATNEQVDKLSGLLTDRTSTINKVEELHSDLTNK